MLAICCYISFFDIRYLIISEFNGSRLPFRIYIMYNVYSAQFITDGQNEYILSYPLIMLLFVIESKLL